MTGINQEDKVITLLQNYKTDNDNEIAKIKIKVKTFANHIAAFRRQCELKVEEIDVYKLKGEHLQLELNMMTDKKSQQEQKEKIRRQNRDKERKSDELRKLEDEMAKCNDSIKESMNLELQVDMCLKIAES